MANQNQPDNLLDYIPVPNIDWERDGNSVQLIVPKFRIGWMQYLCTRFGIRPHMHIHFDEYGSLAWLAFDGKRSILEVGEKLSVHFGDQIEPVYERLAQFIRHLAQKKYIILAPKTGD